MSAEFPKSVYQIPSDELGLLKEGMNALVSKPEVINEWLSKGVEHPARRCLRILKQYKVGEAP